MQDDSAYLFDILNAARNLTMFVRDVSYPDFLKDAKTQYAVRAAFQIIGEGARRVSKHTKDLHPMIPWAEIVAMRHRIVHEYDRISWHIVWEIIKHEIPELIRLLEPLVPPEDEL